MGRRGFFAELQYASRVAARERERSARDVYRSHVAAVREAEKARRAAERAAVQLSKAEAAERKRLEKEAREAHIASMEADVVERNERLREIYDDIDGLLAATLKVDDFVDLRSLRVVVRHPPFDRTDLEVPVSAPVLTPDPSKPLLALPPAPTGLFSFLGKGKHAEAVETAKRAHHAALEEWQLACNAAAVKRKAAREEHARREAERIEILNRERDRYTRQCTERESEAAGHNKRLVELIANLGYGTTDAVQEYVSIVLSNSAYPEHFQVKHEFDFDPTTAELALKVIVPGPTELPDVKGYKYAKASDEIVSTSLSQKESRDRYASAVHQVALRSFHEVFESDRRGLIRTISLEVGAHDIDRATGQRAYIPFVIASAERDSFLAFDLSEVVPALTLDRLGAAVSKNPYGLVRAERSGIRRR